MNEEVEEIHNYFFYIKLRKTKSKYIYIYNDMALTY